jgi:hypothetical protein
VLSYSAGLYRPAEPSLRYYSEKLRPHESLQLVLNLERAQEKSGIKILPVNG